MVDFLKTIEGYGLKLIDVLAYAGAMLAALANAIFTLFTYMRGERTRRLTVDLEEIRRLRSPIDVQVLNLRSEAQNLRSLQGSAGDVAHLRGEVEAVNPRLIEEQLRLASLLKAFDDSKFVEGKNWHDEIEDRWERLLDTLNRAYAPAATVNTVKVAAVAVADLIDALIRHINNRIEEEIRRVSK